MIKPTFQRAVAVSALVLALGAAAAAVAQDRQPGPGAERQRLFEDRQHRREQRLHDLLQIKPDQESAFRTFVASLEQLRPRRGLEAGPGRERGQRAEQPLTAPERLDRAAQRLADAQQRLQKASAAVKTFYAVLTPDQRKAFDAMPMMIGGRGGFGRGGPGGGFDGPRPRG